MPESAVYDHRINRANLFQYFHESGVPKGFQITQLFFIQTSRRLQGVNLMLR
jgi:hypothetical protein